MSTKDTISKTRNYFEPKDNENASYQTSWETAIAKLR